MGSRKNLGASRRGGFNSSVINLPDGVYLPIEQKLRLMNAHSHKMSEIEQQRRGIAPASGTGHNIYSEQVYSKYLNRFRAGGGGDGIKINVIPEIVNHQTTSKLRHQMEIPQQIDGQIPTLNKIYNKVPNTNIGMNQDSVISRNMKTLTYNT